MLRHVSVADLKLNLEPIFKPTLKPDIFLLSQVPVLEPVAVGGEPHGRHGQHEDDHAEGRVVDADGGRLDEPLEVLQKFKRVGSIFEVQYKCR